jgi:hypothetical protein
VMRQLPSWIAHYNEVHPHKALGYRSPREFIAATEDLTVSGRSGATTTIINWGSSACVMPMLWNVSGTCLRPPGTGGPARRWVSGVGLAATVGLTYFAVAYFSLSGLFFLKSEGVAAFWPAAGISLGVLIGLGKRARWPVAAGVPVTLVTLGAFYAVRHRQ